MTTYNAQITVVETNISYVLENIYGDSEPSTGVYSPVQFPLVGAFRMKAYDTGLSATVYWTAQFPDSSGSQYLGAGPLTNIVLISRGK